MTLPNMLIIGAQKCGTTWLHRALQKSEHFWGSTPKELNFWNKPGPKDLEEYAKYFEDAPSSAAFRYESTPHYFRLPKPRVDTAARIRDSLGDIPLILLLRNPVDRYLSAYTHHMMKSRVPVVEEITEISKELGMLDLGNYYTILQHYSGYFSDISIYLHDEIVAEPLSVVNKICSHLDVPCDITPEDLDFRSNDKEKKKLKFRKKNIEFGALPTLSLEVREQLKDHYRGEVSKLQAEYGLNVGSWIE